MEQKYKHILQEVTRGRIDPGTAAEYKAVLSGYFAYLSEQQGNLAKAFAAEWPTLRENSKSVAEADRAWSTSDDGVEERRVKLRKESVEKLISAINSMLFVAEGEARNHY